MTGLRALAARRVPSVTLALCCAVLAAIFATTASTQERVASGPGVVVAAVQHADGATAVWRSESPAGEPHSTPGFDVCAAIACGDRVAGSDAVGLLWSHAWAVRGGALPDVRAPPIGETT
jgi:hypothetical protein